MRFTIKIILMQKWKEEGCIELRPVGKKREAVLQQQPERVQGKKRATPAH